MSSKDKDYHNLIAYVSNGGASGYGPGDVCNKDGNRWSRTIGYGQNECNSFPTPEPIECTPTNRLALTAEVIYVSQHYVLLVFSNQVMIKL